MIALFGQQQTVNEAPLIEIENATVWRETTRVFEGLSLRIPQHQRVAVLGPNGSGKTTLLKLITRELYPVAREDSSVRILGRDRWDVRELRRHIGIVSQDLQNEFMARATVLESIVSGFFSAWGVHAQLLDKIQPEQIEKAEAIMASLGMDELWDRPFSSLSTGQQRRCLLGRALVHDPHTLILDEPTAGLDLSASFEYMKRIRALARAGRNLVLVTHHINEILPEIERVIVLSEGQIVADGAKQDIITPELLSQVYGTAVGVTCQDGHYLAYPAEG